MAITTPPAVCPVSLSDMKIWLKIEDAETYEDDLINGLIASATRYVENFIGQQLLSQTLTDYHSQWSATYCLSAGPMQSVEEIKYLDPDGATQTVAASDYYVDTVRGIIIMKESFGYPEINEEPNPITIISKVGMAASASDIPADLLTAIKLHVAEYYEHRSDYARVKYSAVNGLLRHYKAEPYV